MLLPIELRLQLQADRDVYVTEACDRCGKLLGSLRFARRDEAGAWCSRECRDGVEAAQKRIASRGGRPRKYKNNAEKCRAHRNRIENLLTDTKPISTPLITNGLQTQNQALAIPIP